jgi:hypothetical protein
LHTKLDIKRRDESIRNKPYEKRHNINSLGSDLTTAIQNFHYSGGNDKKIDDEKTLIEKIKKDKNNSITYVVIGRFIKTMIENY